MRVLIISPTRELAEQTHAAIGALGRQMGLRSLTIYRGVGAQPQIMGNALALATQDDLPMIRTIERLLGCSLERLKLTEGNEHHLSQPTTHSV